MNVVDMIVHELPVFINFGSPKREMGTHGEVASLNTNITAAAGGDNIFKEKTPLVSKQL